MPHNETVTRTLFYFDELSDKAKDKARAWYRNGALDYEWWESTYDDAERIGLQITEFDLDRSRYAKGKLLLSPKEVCQAILREHGTGCDTCKLATEFLEGIHLIEHEESQDEEDHEEERDTLRDEFEAALLEEYSLMLQHEYEYLLSDEAVDESIRANEYEFTEDGKRA